jgi:ABC-type Zn uptake system ZnuABC Zn-binding protein ZnuA
MKKMVFAGLLLAALIVPAAAQARLKVVCTYPYIGDLARTLGGDRVEGDRPGQGDR